MFWVYLTVNLYLISMLVFVSVEFFGDSDFNKISAFGSVLGGIGTCFAAFVALYFYNDWKEQHNAQIKYNYLNNTISILRSDLVSIAPILNKVIIAGEKYQHEDIVSLVDFDLKIVHELYSSHKTADLLFKEYYSVFKDDSTYLLYLKFSYIMEKTLNSLLTIHSIASDLEKLEEITRQLQIVAIPHKFNKNTITSHNICKMLPLDLYRQVEVYYFSIIDYLTNYKIKE